MRTMYISPFSNPGCSLQVALNTNAFYKMLCLLNDLKFLYVQRTYETQNVLSIYTETFYKAHSACTTSCSIAGCDGHAFVSAHKIRCLSLDSMIQVCYESGCMSCKRF